MKNALPLPAQTRAFSLIELLVSMSVLSLIMLLVFQMLDRTQTTWKKSRDAVSEFKDARTGFEAITRRLSQATINPFWSYTTNASGIPSKFQRESDLHFVSGPTNGSKVKIMGSPPAGAGERVTHCMFFQAPTGESNLTESAGNNTERLKYREFPNMLNGWGYFVEFGSDESERPEFVNSLDNKPRTRFRYRLMEFNQPAERLQIYDEALRQRTTPQSTALLNKWFLNNTLYGCNCPNNYDVSAHGLERNQRLVAENIIALVLLPAESVTQNLRADLAPNYYYDSRAWQGTQSAQAGKTVNVTKSKHSLPPIVDVMMVAVDEADFNRFAQNQQIDALAKSSQAAFTKSLFETAADFDKDLATLKARLSAETSEFKTSIRYRVFRASVRLREAKWGGFSNIN